MLQSIFLQNVIFAKLHHTYQFYMNCGGARWSGFCIAVYAK